MLARERRAIALPVRRLLFGTGAVLGSTLVFAVATVVGAIVHIGTPPARRVIANVLNHSLANVLLGTITVDRVDRLGLRGLGGLRVTIRDPHGSPVITAEDVQADFDALAMARSLLVGKGDFAVTLDRVRIGHAEVVLAEEEDRRLTLVDTFSVRAPNPHPTSPGGRGLSLSFPDVTLADAWGHGQIGSAPPIDAEVRHVRASFHYDPRVLTLDARHVDLEARGLPENVDPVGVVQGRMRIPSSVSGQSADAAIAFDGVVARQHTMLSCALLGDKVDGQLAIPRIDPDTLKGVVAASKLAEPGSVHIEVHGSLPALTAQGHIVVGAGRTDLRANARFEAITTVDATVDASKIDLRTIGLGEPSALGFHVSASASVAGGQVDGTFRMDSPTGVVGDESVPVIHASGQFTDLSVRGTADIAEPGAPAHVTFHLHPLTGPNSPRALDFDVRADAPELARVPRVVRIARSAQGGAHVRARGRLLLQDLRITADVHADTDHLVASEGKVRVGSGRLDASVSGPLANVTVKGEVRGDALGVYGYAFKNFDVTTRGSMEGARVSATFAGEDTPDIVLAADVRVGSTTTIEDVGLTLRRADVHMVGHVRRILVEKARTSLDGVTIEGLGKAPVVASVRLSAGGLAVVARGGDLDLGRVSRLLNVKDEAPEGHVAFDVDVSSTAHDAKGKVKLDLYGGKFAGMNGASGRLVASFDGRHFKAELRGALGEAGWATVVVDDAVLGGGLLEGSSWRFATGHLFIDTNIDLSELVRVAPAGALPFDEAAGRVSLTGRIGRSAAKDMPDIDAEMTTKGLVLVGRGTKATDADGAETLTTPFQTHGADAELGVHLKGRTRDTSIAARVFDAKGTFVRFAAQGAFPIERLLHDPKGAIAELERTPLQAHVIVPRRSFADFPEFAKAQVARVRGAMEAAVDVDGTALGPHVDARVRGFDLAPTNAYHAKLVNLDLHATYVGDKADVVVKVARPKAFILEAEAGVNARFADLLDANNATPVWKAHARVRFNDFPLDTIPGVATNKVVGTLSGNVTLDGLHKDARLDVNLGLKELRVGRAAFSGGTITAHAEHGTLTAAARLNQTDGYAETHFEGGLEWADHLAPTFDEHRPITATLNAKAFRIAIAQPFLGDAISDLDGRIDANTKLTYDVGAKNGKVTGAVHLRDGAVDIPSAGGSFYAVEAQMTMDPFGTVHVDDVSANGVSGRLTASALAKFDGISFRSANAQLHIRRGQKLPVEIQGVPMGYAWGDINVDAQVSPDGKKITANIDVPSLHVDLPQSTGHSVQALAPNPNVKVGVDEPKGAFAIVHLEKPVGPRPPDSSDVHVVVHLGKDVWIKRQAMLNVRLGGGPVVDVASETRVSGQISSDRGMVEVQGKRFEIDSATVSFVGKDPGNPQIVATAHWDAPDKTRVTVQVSGTPEHIEVALHSEPSLPRDALLSLILFGDQSGTGGASQTGPSGDDEDVNKAAGLAGGVVTEGLNKAISGITTVDISTRVDTSESQNPRPELAVQLTNDVSATVIYNLGLPPPGQNPDRTQVVLDYKFYRGWSLLTTFGDAGSSIADLLWQYRY